MAKITMKDAPEILVGVGALNWGLTIFGVNLVDMLANAVNLPVLGTIVYGAVGLAGAQVLAKKFGLMK